MGNKIVVLQRNKGDDAKLQNIKKLLNPLKIVEYQANATIPPVQGSNIDYVLFTGGHGNFIASQPTQLNGTTAANARKWLGESSGLEADAFILDTCFSSAFVPAFSGMIPVGGAIVCAHGSGEGFTDALLNANNAGKTVGVALGGIVDGVTEMGLGFTSLSLYVRSQKGLKLYTINGGENRDSGLQTRGNFGMDHDSADELGQLDRFLMGKLIAIEVVTPDALKAKLKENLKMTV